MNLPIIPWHGARPYPPRSSELTVLFWEGLRHGLWRTTQCEACGELSFPPKKVCPFCWATTMRWGDLATAGEIYSWTRIHAAPAAFCELAPYLVGIIDLDDGVRLACMLVANEAAIPSCGDRVEIVILSAEDGPLFAARITDKQIG